MSTPSDKPKAGRPSNDPGNDPGDDPVAESPGLQPFFSLQQHDEDAPPEVSEEALTAPEEPLSMTEEEPTIREDGTSSAEITAYHSLAIDGLAMPADPFDDPTGDPLDTQALTAEIPAAGEASEIWESDDRNDPLPTPPPLGTESEPDAGESVLGRTMESWGDLEESEGDPAGATDNEWDTMGDDAPLSDNLEDSLEWDRTQGGDTSDLLSMTGASMRTDTEAVHESSGDDRWVALSVDDDEVSGGDSISLVGGADADLPDPDGDTVVERMALGFARETAEEEPPAMAPASDEDEPSIPAMIVEQGIDAFKQGDRAFALSCFEQALRGDPDDSRAQSYLELTHDLYVRDHLQDAGLHSIPRLRVGREMLMTLELDPQAGGVLAMIDGMATVEEIETMLPYFERETIYRHLADALEEGLIEFLS